MTTERALSEFMVSFVSTLNSKQFDLFVNSETLPLGYMEIRYPLRILNISKLSLGVLELTDLW